MKNPFKYLFLLTSLLSACASTPYKVKITEEIMNTFSKQVKKEKNLIMIASGWSFKEKLKTFVLRYAIVKKVGIEQARELFIETCEGLLKLANANEEIRPLLIDYPFTYKNLDIMISFDESTNASASPPFIALVSILDGVIRYKTDNCITNMFDTVHKETYEEALKIYNQKKFKT
jgi:hypothetical protein